MKIVLSLKLIQMKKIIAVFVHVTLFTLTVWSQHNVNVKLITLGYYPLDEPNLNIHSNKIDEEGRITYEPGLLFSYEDYLSMPFVSIEITQAIYNDCANRIGGFTHFGLRYLFMQKYKHKLSAGIGPSLYYRNDWSAIAGYTEDTDYKLSGSWQYRIWFGAEIEYDYYLSTDGDISISLNMLHPQAVTLAVGYRYWFSRKPRRKCSDCPSFSKH